MNRPTRTGNSGDARRLAGSFRDPSGFVYQEGGTYLRQINRSYSAQYTELMGGGLYDRLTELGLLLPHEEKQTGDLPEPAYKIIRPQQLGFVSYPYEWCFSQLKDAALATLDIQKIALEYGFTLKDASAYNVQFIDARAVFIDTLSFDFYETDSPWVAYRQFCQQFLAPLALMSKTDMRLGALLTNFIDGIPLDLASRLLPAKTKLNLGLLFHLHLHAAKQNKHADDAQRAKQARVKKTGLVGIIDMLISTIEKLTWQPAGTEWADYYSATNYSDRSGEHKAALVRGYLRRSRPTTVWDLGANTGMYSRLAVEQGASVVAFDIDPAAVEQNYLWCKANAVGGMLPLSLDLTNPTPAIGWANTERQAALDRGPADTAMALALIHHLALSNNTPLEFIAAMMAGITSNLIIEFVPKEDSQVKRLLATRPDIFPDYHEDGFEAAFSIYFDVMEKCQVGDSYRTLYLMKRR